MSDTKKNCQSGCPEICAAAKHDGVVCADHRCDIDDGIRMTTPSVPPIALAGEPVAYVNQADLDLLANYGASGACVLYNRPVGNATIPLFAASTPSASSVPMYAQHCDELTPRTPGEKAAYLEGIEEGKMRAKRDAAPQANAQAASVPESRFTKLWFSSGQNYMQFARALLQANGATK